MSDGSFSERAREAIYAVTDGRCAGCLRTSPLTAQHRRARGRGGTSDASIGHPANGVPLCGSGTTLCHGWAEAHPTDAALLGWRLEAGDDPLKSPLYLRPYGWRRYEVDGRTLLHTYVDTLDLNRFNERRAALARFLLTINPPPVLAWPRSPKGNR